MQVWCACSDDKDKLPLSDAAVERSTEKRQKDRSGGVLRIQVDHIPQHLNTLVSRDIWCRRIVFRNIFEPLVIPKASGGYQPFLAASMTIKAAGRRFLFKLRPGVTFHDGRPLTSSDVQYTLEKVAKWGKGPLRLLKEEMASLAEVRAPNETTVEVILNRTNYLFPSVLAEIGILPAHLYGKRGVLSVELNAMPVGTGPFRVARRTEQRTLTLERNERYWGQPARLARVVLVAITDPAQALSSLRNGQLDMLPNLHPSYYPDQIRTRSMQQRFRVVRLHPYRLQTLIFNQRKKVLRDRRVRQALIHLTDRQQMLKNIRNNLGQVLSAPLWTLSPWYDRTIHPHSYDRAAAAQLLDDAGWTTARGKKGRYKMGWPLTLKILRAKESGAMAEAARILKAELVAAGIDADIQVGDFAFIKAQLKRGKYDLVLLGLAPRPGSDLSPLLHSRGPLNVGNYSNSTVDRILTLLRTMPPRGDSQRLMRRLHRILHDDPPMAVLYAPVEVMLVSRKVHGLAQNGRWPRLSTLFIGEAK